MCQPVPYNYDSPRVAVLVLDIFDKADRHLSTSAFSGQLRDHLFRSLISNVDSVIDAVAGSGVSILQLGLQYYVRLPDFTPIYDTHFMPILLALTKVPSSLPTVFVLSALLSVTMTLNCGSLRLMTFHFTIFNATSDTKC